jgi:alginate O-acetyltransferase complex protein AlgI
MFYMQTDGAKILGNFEILKVSTIIGLMFLCHWVMRNRSVKEVASKVPAWALGVVWSLMIFLIIIAQGSGEQFIYFQF